MPPCAVFDLDDTLIDTRGVLVPIALRRVSEVTGIPVERLNDRGKRIDEVLEPCFPLDAEVREAAATAWYTHEVPHLTPLPGAIETLEALHGRIPLVLLTRGDPERQERKIDRSGLRGWFEEVVIRPIEQPGSKRHDLERILGVYRVRPSSCAVIGDDPTDELAHARALGCLVIRVPETPLAAIPPLLEHAGLLTTRQGS